MTIYEPHKGYEYGYRTFRSTHDEDGSIDVRVCTRCGALIDDDRRETHDEWHAQISPEVSE